MKVALQAWGSDGDIRPMIALAAGLVRRGHQATLAIGSVDDKDYREMCRAVGVGCVYAPEKSAADVNGWLRKLGHTRNPFRMLRFLHEQALFPAHESMSLAAARLAAEAELAVGHFLCVPLRIAAEKRAVPYATVAFWPGLVADRARPPDGLPALGKWLNGLLWRAGLRLIDRAVGAGYRALYEKHGLAYPGSVLESCYSKQLNLLAASGALWPQVDALAQHRFCGPFELPEMAEPEPLSPALEAFLAAGEPPVFLTLGSMGQIDPDDAERLLVEAAEASGARAIVQRDPRRPPLRATSDRLAFVGRTRHAALLPRCGAVLHHGGAGTTHTVLASGRPAVVVGFMEEQLSWGRALRRQGVGGRVFRYGACTAKQLGAALGAAARDPALRLRAAELGAKLRLEDGVIEACRQLEQLVKASGSGAAGSIR